MTCREVIEFLGKYLDGELALEERKAFEHHLTLCDDCVEYLSNYKQTVSLERAALPADAPAEAALPPGLIQAVLKAMRSGAGETT